MTRKEFEALVRKALRSLPKVFKDKLSNVGIVIEGGRGASRDLLGLYEGVPLADRSHSYNMAMPDKITLFKRNLEAEARSNGTLLVEEIRLTIEHEIAHHFGITDERLRREKIY